MAQAVRYEAPIDRIKMTINVIEKGPKPKEAENKTLLLAGCYMIWNETFANRSKTNSHHEIPPIEKPLLCSFINS